MVGYGGGREAVIPGICALDTRTQNHLWVLGRKSAETNPLCAWVGCRRSVHEDMMEIVALVRPDFSVNIVPNLAGEIAGIFAGNSASAWWKAPTWWTISGVPIAEEADIVIATAAATPRISTYTRAKNH